MPQWILTGTLYGKRAGQLREAARLEIRHAFADQTHHSVHHGDGIGWYNSRVSASSKSSDYLRAEAACLDARGYSVK